MDTQTIAKIDGVSLAYREGETWLQVLYKVSLSIQKGEILGVVGESGCGKSSLANLLLAHRHSNSRLLEGTIEFESTNIFSLDREALNELRGNQISFVPQNPATSLSPGMKVGDQIAEVLRAHKQTYKQTNITARIIELFNSVGLPNPSESMKRYPHQLSGGQQQRVVIAMALACDPKLIVLDEPTTGLDVTTQKQILLVLAQLRSKIGTSMLYVTHDLGVLSMIADRVCVMYAGHVVELASAKIVFQRAFHPYTRGLIRSMPQFEQKGIRKKESLRGLLKRKELPQGCPFQPRCGIARSSCADSMQKLVAVAQGHFVACEYAAEEIEVEHTVTDDVATLGKKGQQFESLLDFVDVSLRYTTDGIKNRILGRRPETIVDNVSFSIGRGEVFALVGESGSGKSTIARALSGLITPVEGRIDFDGSPLVGLARERSRQKLRQIQYIFQNPDESLNPRAKIGEILARPLKMFFDLDNTEMRLRIAEALHTVRLDDSYVSRYPDQLSGGERQRVAIARALVAEPDLLLADEILTAMDVSVQSRIIELLGQLKKETQIAMLFISHDLAVVRSIADQVGVLYKGQLVEIGSVDKLFLPPFHPYTLDLIDAVPHFSSRRPEVIDPIDDESPDEISKGCPYASRCSRNLGDQCTSVVPQWREIGPSHRLRCHLSLTDLGCE